MTTSDGPLVDDVFWVLASGEGLRGRCTPTPAVSHAILTYNRGRKAGLADGIVITPSHNPPHDGGFKYNPPHGGPAEPAITNWIEGKANEFLESGLRGVNRIPYEQVLRAATTHRHDYLNAYVADLGNVIDMEVFRTREEPDSLLRGSAVDAGSVLGIHGFPVATRSRDARPGCSAQGPARVEDRRGQQRGTRTQRVPHSHVQARLPRGLRFASSARTKNS